MYGSDVKYYRRPKAEALPLISGHEPCGIVVATGPGVTGPHAVVGERVMVHHYHGCTDCAHCRSGWPQMCASAPQVCWP